MKTNYEIFTSDIDKLAQLLEYNSQQGCPDWMEWFEVNCCSQCEPIEFEVNGNIFEDTPCYVKNHKCPYISGNKSYPDDKDIIKLWLMSEYEDNYGG